MSDTKLDLLVSFLATIVIATVGSILITLIYMNNGAGISFFGALVWFAFFFALCIYFVNFFFNKYVKEAQWGRIINGG